MNKLESLRDECLKCTKCEIGGQQVNGCLSNVFSNMNMNAEVMAVGQNPGKDEIKQGVPFIGVSGKFFDKCLLQVGMSRDQFYVSNTVRCFTPGNRPPRQGELENCRDFLDREVKIVKPKLIVALGSHSFAQLTGMKGIMKHHGKPVFSIRYSVDVMPILHPSPLNTNQPDKRRMFMDDLRAVKDYLDALD
jgi:uracil-DNA glycosylase family 4